VGGFYEGVVSARGGGKHGTGIYELCTVSYIILEQ